MNTLASCADDGEPREHTRKQGKVIWLYGLSGAGKTTLAEALEKKLQSDGYPTVLLDGDNLRSGLNKDLGFGDRDREENIRRVSEVAKLFASSGVIAICSLITPLRAHRARVRETISGQDLIEVYVAASYEVCARRDTKGLYSKAALGLIVNFTGKDSAFEAPFAGEVSIIVPTEVESAAESSARLYLYVKANLGDVA